MFCKRQKGFGFLFLYFFGGFYCFCINNVFVHPPLCPPPTRFSAAVSIVNVASLGFNQNIKIVLRETGYKERNSQIRLMKSH